jgi:hypothetical protein
VVVAAGELDEDARLLPDRPGVVARREQHDVTSGEVLLATVTDDTLSAVSAGLRGDLPRRAVTVATLISAGNSVLAVLHLGNDIQGGS